MALSAIQRAHVENRLSEYCETRIRPEVRDRLRLNFRITDNEVVLFEERPRFLKPKEWGEEPVAKFRYVKSRNVWRLYCQFSDLRWHEYRSLHEADDFETLLAEVDEDPTCIFWG